MTSEQFRPDALDALEYFRQRLYQALGAYAPPDDRYSLLELIRPVESLVTSRAALGNLLAVMFADGGHRQSEIGDDMAAADDAIGRYYALIGRVDVAEFRYHELARKVRALQGQLIHDDGCAAEAPHALDGSSCRVCLVLEDYGITTDDIPGVPLLDAMLKEAVSR